MDDLDRELATARDRLAAAGGRVHAVGAGGVGMAGVARLLQSRGFRVDGCDAAPNRLTAWLERHGVAVRTGHDATHVAGADWVVHTPAVRRDHPELAAASAGGAAVTRRGCVLPALLPRAGSVAVAGTHGKTTVANMLAQVLLAAGWEPGYCVGGESAALEGVAAPGAGRAFVAEADESDGTLRLYRPEIAIVTNIDFDHMEHFRDEREFRAVFERFVAGAGRTVYCADDPRAAEVCGATAAGLSYGFAPGAAYRLSEPAASADGQRFRVRGPRGADVGVALPLPGRHNARNAAAALAAASELGCDPAAAAAALAGYRRARRRLEKVAEGRGIVVYSDYAHHPAEIRALIASVAGFPRRRLLAVFQPHRYTRTRALGAEFPAAFEGVERLILAPVYAASEPELAGGTSRDLLERFRAHGGVPVEYADSLDEAWRLLCARWRAGDLVLVVGAGDIEALAARAAAELGARGPAAGGAGPA